MASTSHPVAQIIICLTLNSYSMRKLSALPATYTPYLSHSHCLYSYWHISSSSYYRLSLSYYFYWFPLLHPYLFLIHFPHTRQNDAFLKNEPDCVISQYNPLITSSRCIFNKILTLALSILNTAFNCYGISYCYPAHSLRSGQWLSSCSSGRSSCCISVFSLDSLSF